MVIRWYCGTAVVPWYRVVYIHVFTVDSSSLGSSTLVPSLYFTISRTSYYKIYTLV